MTPHLTYSDSELERSFLALTAPDLSEYATPSDIEEVFSILSLTRYENDTGFHLFRLRAPRCPVCYLKISIQ